MAKTGGTRKHLVCQHLENLSRVALEKYQDVIRDFVRQRHGIYALYRKDRLYYVGLASNLRTRLTAHLRDRHSGTWDRFSIYLTIGDDRLRELEALLMRIAKPRGNIQKGKLPRSQDLRKAFKSRATERMKKEISSLLESDRMKPIVKARRPVAAEGKASTLAKYTSAPFQIRLRHKGKTHKARVRRDGSIRVKGKIFTSPSLAGKFIRGITTNGWVSWEFERAPGDWVPLDKLRR